MLTQYLIGFVCVLALLASPSGVSADDEQEGGLSPKVRERTRQRWDPSTYDLPTNKGSPSSELDLKLDSADIELTPTAATKVDGYTVEEMERRLKRTKMALGVSVVPIVVGGFLYLFSYPEKKPLVCLDLLGSGCPGQEREWLRIPGAAVLASGVTWMIVAGTMHSVRRRKLREVQQAKYGTPRRVEWDLARSRLVF